MCAKRAVITGRTPIGDPNGGFRTASVPALPNDGRTWRCWGTHHSAQLLKQSGAHPHPDPPTVTVGWPVPASAAPARQGGTHPVAPHPGRYSLEPIASTGGVRSTARVGSRVAVTVSAAVPPAMTR